MRRKRFVRTIPFSHKLFFERFLFLTNNEIHYTLLESGKSGRYSVAGYQPFAIVQGSKEGLTITTNQSNLIQTGDPLKLFFDWHEQFQIDGDPIPEGMPSGSIGFLSYDYARFIEKLPNLTEDDLGLPILYFVYFSVIIIFDHQEDTLTVLWVTGEHSTADQFELLVRTWSSFVVGKVNTEPKEQSTAVTSQALLKESKSESVPSLHVSMSDESFQQAVLDVQKFIRAGDVFQVNISVRQRKKVTTDAIRIYEKIREVNPSPYMGYFHTPMFQIVTASPELLVKKKGKSIFTRPIAGTRPRGVTDEQDLHYEEELRSNQKELAEHVMMVDLERNDLGKVCTFGSVEVKELLVVEKYSHVMHLVSYIQGELSNDKSNYDVIHALFPGGTITGAPKVRTMEIIEALEPEKRGVYTGSLGWISFEGDLEFNILIRTMLIHRGEAIVQAGAGIVLDSIPEREYNESIQKAKALWEALDRAEGRYI